MQYDAVYLEVDKKLGVLCRHIPNLDYLWPRTHLQSAAYHADNLRVHPQRKRPITCGFVTLLKVALTMTWSGTEIAVRAQCTAYNVMHDCLLAHMQWVLMSW